MAPKVDVFAFEMEGQYKMSSEPLSNVVPAIMVRRKQRSCHQCRTKHLKCDGEFPCGHCRRGVRNCSKEPDHIFPSESNLGVVRRKKKYDLSFGGDQRWVDLPPVTFATKETVPSSDSAQGSGRSSPGARVSNSSQSITPYFTPPVDPFNTSPLIFDSAGRLAEASCPLHADNFDHVSAARQPQTGPLWPFGDYQEVMLMQHFVENIAPWFDHSDRLKHFATVIPFLAASSPTLLNAVLACASKHMSLTGLLDESITLRYQDACYSTLLPNLQTKAFEAPMLASVVLLRLVLQMTARGSLDLTDRKIDAFLGIEVFANAWKQHPESSLHSAIFMSVLRLYIHVAWIDKKPLLQVRPNCCLMPRVCPDPMDSRRWNGSITLIVARALDYCYDDEPKTLERWLELQGHVENWQKEKPAAFEPIFEGGVERDHPFGKIVFAEEVHAASQMFYCLARLLLARSPPAGAWVCEAHDGAQAECLRLLRRICATTEGHADSFGVKLISLAPIADLGHLLLDRSSQERALHILETAQSNIEGNTSPEAFAHLRSAWQWS